MFFHIINLPKPFNCSLEDDTPEGIRHRFVCFRSNFGKKPRAYFYSFLILPEAVRASCLPKHTFRRRIDSVFPTVILVSRICAIVGDVSVLVVTWWNTYPLYKMQQGLVTRQSVVRVMLYDGTCTLQIQLTLSDG